MTPREIVRAFYKAQAVNERVSRLIDLGRALGFEGNEKIAVGMVRDFGHGARVVQAMGRALTAEGDPWELARGTLRNGYDETGRRRPQRGARNTADDEVERAKQA